MVNALESQDASACGAPSSRLPSICIPARTWGPHCPVYLAVGHPQSQPRPHAAWSAPFGSSLSSSLCDPAPCPWNRAPDVPDSVIRSCSRPHARVPYPQVHAICPRVRAPIHTPRRDLRPFVTSLTRPTSADRPRHVRRSPSSRPTGHPAPQVSFVPSFKLITFRSVSFTRLHRRRTT